MDKVENSARKTGRDQFLVGCQCEKEGDKSLFSLHSAYHLSDWSHSSLAVSDLLFEWNCNIDESSLATDMLTTLKRGGSLI